jgi:hypothetical protein
MALHSTELSVLKVPGTEHPQEYPMAECHWVAPETAQPSVFEKGEA